MASNKVYRPAGMLESYHITRQNLKLDANVQVAGRFVAVSGSDDKTRLTLKKVYPALVHAVQTHAALSVRIVRTNGDKHGYVFERMETIDLEKAVRFLDAKKDADEEDLAVLMEREFTQPITSDSDSDVPLWRLTITSQNTVLFAWHHCIGDGQSGLAFLRTLLAGLNAPHTLHSDFDVRAVKTSVDLQLTPPIEELTDLSVSFRTLVSVLAGLVIPSSWTARRTWTGNTVLSTAGVFRTRAPLVCISPAQSTRLLTAARARRTTLTAVLYLLGVGVLAKLVSSDDRNAKYKRLSLSVPASLRPLAKVSPTAMGEFVSTHHSTARLPCAPSVTGFDWVRAAAFSKKLHAAVPKTREVIGSLKYLNGRYEGYHKGRLGKKREVSLELSNVGAFRTDLDLDTKARTGATNGAEPEWSITDAYFTQDDGIAGPALKMNSAGSPSGSVNISVTWGEGAVDDAFAEAFVRDLGAAIEKLDSDLASKKEEKA